MFWILRWILFALAVMFTAWLIPGISVDGFWSALWVCVILGIINVFIKPLIYLISLPINILTLGLFGFVINALLLLLAGHITPGFAVDGFWSALLGSIVLSILGVAVNQINSQSELILIGNGKICKNFTYYGYEKIRTVYFIFAYIF